MVRCIAHASKRGAFLLAALLLLACAKPYFCVDDAVRFENGQTRMAAFAQDKTGWRLKGVSDVEVRFLVDGREVSSAVTDERGFAKSIVDVDGPTDRFEEHGYFREPVVTSLAVRDASEQTKYKTRALRSLRKYYTNILVGIGSADIDARSYGAHGMIVLPVQPERAASRHSGPGDPATPVARGVRRLSPVGRDSFEGSFPEVGYGEIGRSGERVRPFEAPFSLRPSMRIVSNRRGMGPGDLLGKAEPSQDGGPGPCSEEALEYRSG